MGYGLRRGLGTTITWGGTPVYSQGELPALCGAASWLRYATTPQCWAYERSAWGQMAALPPVPDLTVSPHAIPSAYGNGPATVEQAKAETDAVLAEAWSAQHDNVVAWGSTLPDNPIPDVPCTWFNVPCWLVAVGLGVGALGVFGAVAGSSRRFR